MVGGTMASKQFELRTEPHTATIGDVTLLFRPEVVAAEFAAAYVHLQDAQKEVSSKKETGPEELAALSAALKEFIGAFLMPESVPVFEGVVWPERIYVQLTEWVSELYGGGAGASAQSGN